MKRYIDKYLLDYKKNTIEKTKYEIIEERDITDDELGFSRILYKTKNEKGNPMICYTENFGKIAALFDNQWQVLCLNDGTNEKENDIKARKLFVDFIDNLQKKVEDTYRENTQKHNEIKDAIFDYFENPKLDFIGHIKRQAIQCKEMLSSCDCIENIRRLRNWGYGDDEVMVDINDNGLLPLGKALKESELVNDYEIYCIQLESFENLGTVLYDFKEEKMYFSVYKGDDEYAIIEDTTLETLEEDYQDYLDKENMER